MTSFAAQVLEHVRTERGAIEPAQIVADLEHLRDVCRVRDIPADLPVKVGAAIAELLTLGRLKWDGAAAVVWVAEKAVVQRAMF